MKFSLALLAAGTLSVLAHVPSSPSGQAPPRKTEDVFLKSYGATVEDDGCGLVTITVPVRLDGDWKEATARAEAAAELWKKQACNPAVAHESTGRRYHRSGTIAAIVKHLLYGAYPPCFAPPPKP